MSRTLIIIGLVIVAIGVLWQPPSMNKAAKRQINGIFFTKNLSVERVTQTATAGHGRFQGQLPQADAAHPGVLPARQDLDPPAHLDAA